MVAILPAKRTAKAEAIGEAVKTTALFPYLKPCSPAPGIVATPKTTEASQKATPSPPTLGKRRRRWLALAFGLTHSVAIGLGLWVPSLWKRLPPGATVSPQQGTHEQLLQGRLWQALGTQALADTLLAAKEQRLDQQLAAAEQSRLQAQQLRLEAEADAQNLTRQAENRARQTKVDALRQADLIQLDTTLIGAEQVIYAEPGEAVTLKFMARIQCEEGSFGETATATPSDTRIAAREIRNLAQCYPSPETAAGEPIGEVGDWPIAFLKQEPQ